MISLENNPFLKTNNQLEKQLKEMHENRKRLFEDYSPTKFPPLTEKQIYDLITTVYD